MTKVDICMATFRRPAVVEALASLAHQELPPEVLIRVIVADNDDTPSAQTAVIEAAADLGLDLVYAHAPARNISIARNAGLDLARGDFVGFMDDDEIAAPDWLAAALKAVDTHQVDGVFGPAFGVYPASAPAWMKALRAHDNIPVRRAGVVETGHTCNALIRRAAIGDQRFRIEVGTSGGEDTEFFRRLWLQGARFEIADKAVMSEPVAAARLSYQWLANRSYRAGHTYGAYLDGSFGRRAGFALGAGIKAGFCYAMALGFSWSRQKRAKWALRGLLHLGVISGSLGHRAMDLYGA